MGWFFSVNTQNMPRISEYLTGTTLLAGAGKGNRTPDSTLGRSRLTTKLYPRVIVRLTNIRQRTIVYGLTAGLASLFLFGLGQPASATESTPTVIPAATIQHGQTFTLPDGAKAGVFAGAVTTDVGVTWTVSEATVPTLPTDRALLGSVYRLSISGATAFTPGVARPAAVILPFGSSHWNRQIWQYDNV